MESRILDSYLDFFNACKAIMLLIDPSDGKILDANKAAMEYYGYSRETITNLFSYNINTLSKTQIQEEIQNVLNKKRNYFNFIHRLSNGETREVKVHSSPIEYQGKKILLSIVHDISDKNEQLTLIQNDLDSMLAAIPDLLFELGLDGRYYKIRSTRTELMAAPPKEMLGKTVSDVMPPLAASICLSALKEANETGISEGKQFSLNLKGISKWFELSISKKTNDYTEGPHFIVLSRDITNRKETEKNMRDSEARFKALHDASSGGIVIHEKGKVLECNARLLKLFGYSYEEAIGMNGLLFISGKSLDIVKNNIHNAFEEPYEVVGQHKDGTEFPMRIESREIIYKGKSTRVTEFNDISQEKIAQDKLKHLANYDVLTNLPNRALFAKRLQQAMAHAKRYDKYLAVVYIDLDEFKEINDNYGHAIGDKLLIAISQNMKDVLRDDDTIARFGGDEFVATIANLEKAEDYEATLKRLLNAVSTPIEIEDIQLQVCASLGVTIYPNDNEDTDILIRHADQAMYRAKQDGKNRYHAFNVDEDSTIKNTQENIKDIAHGLKNEEFVLFYQPKVNIKTGQIFGVEALIRWQHPQKGLLPPMQFLPFIEHHKLSCEVGEWVINTALKQIESWSQDGLEIPISVNVGAKQLQNNFVSQLSNLLNKYPHVDPKLLEIEILETSFLEEILHVSEVIKTCTQMGVKFSIDDFGTGYSSLTYLKLLPANLLKIDKSFICDMTKSNNDLSIVKAIIALAKAFNINVIAEGVESIEHIELLLSLGCELAQGYVIAKPMKVKKIPAWITQWENNKH